MAELDEHPPRCFCYMCSAKRWLRYTPEEDRYPVGVTLKIATYGGKGAGSHEPDSNFDAVCTEADFQRALDLIPSDWLRKVARTWMGTPYPLPQRHGPKTRREAVMGKLNVSQSQLDGLIDECARAMAVQMGERHTGRPNRRTPLISIAIPIPPEEPQPVGGWSKLTPRA